MLTFTAILIVFRAQSSMRMSVGELRRKSVQSDTSDSSDFTEKGSDTTTASVQLEATIKAEPTKSTQRPIPADVVDFDREIWEDPTQVPEYAYDIFEYLKEREEDFQIDNYLQRQPHLTRWMRTLLVDWMVEVQESFEMNHETLYLAVKIVDIYLSKVQIEKEKLQLVGCAALFLSSKYDVSATNWMEKLIDCFQKLIVICLCRPSPKRI